MKTLKKAILALTVTTFSAFSFAQVSTNGNIIIGTGSATDANSISLGGGTASNGGIAIGSGSTSNRNDEVNIGDRNITGVKDGVANSDAANVGQLNSSANSTLNSANNYTDQKKSEYVTESNNYTDQQINKYLNGQGGNIDKSYIDGSFYRLNKKIEKNYLKAQGGIAGAMAMASIPEREGFDTSVGVGVANYRSQQSIAIGARRNTSESTVVKFNVSTDTQGGTGVGAGFAFGL